MRPVLQVAASYLKAGAGAVWVSQGCRGTVTVTVVFNI